MYDGGNIDRLLQIVEMDNVAEHLTDAARARFGFDALDGYNLDHASMKEWRESMKKGVELAKLVKEDKSYPFDKASNVKYPLITTAALQFNGKSYPAIVPGDGVVKAKVLGQDPQGMKAALGKRVASYMSWQFMSEIEEWEEETDKLLVCLPIVGQMFRKVWFDPIEGRIRCRLIEPGALVLNAKARSLEQAPRISEEIYLFPDEIASRVRSGMYREAEYTQGDERSKNPELFIEQHCRADLDEDGYEEPYVVTFHKATGEVARIVADFEPQDIQVGMSGVARIKRTTYFVGYQFMPAMDGGFFGTGFGLLLGDISESNQHHHQLNDGRGGIWHRLAVGFLALNSASRVSHSVSSRASGSLPQQWVVIFGNQLFRSRFPARTQLYSTFLD